MFIRSSFETHSAMVHTNNLKRDFIPPNTRDGAEVSLRRPPHSQERMRKKKSACSVRNDGWVWGAVEMFHRASKGGSCLAPRGVIRLYVFSPLRDLAGGQHAWRAGAEGCIGRGGIALCGCCLSVADVCQARACVGDDACALCHP